MITFEEKKMEMNNYSYKCSSVHQVQNIMYNVHVFITQFHCNTSFIEGL